MSLGSETISCSCSTERCVTPVGSWVSPCQVRKLDARDAADVFHALQCEVLAREHPLDARLAQGEPCCNLGISDAARLQVPFEEIDKRCGSHSEAKARLQ